MELESLMSGVTKMDEDDPVVQSVRLSYLDASKTPIPLILTLKGQSREECCSY